MTKEKDLPPKEDERKIICETIHTLENILTAVKPIPDLPSFTEGSKWESVLQPHNMEEVEDKIMEMVRKLK